MKKITITLGLLLSACSTAPLKPIAEGVSKTQSEAVALHEMAAKGTPIAQPQPEKKVKYDNSLWFPVSKINDEFPKAISEQLKRNVVVNRRFMTINETTSFITSLTGISCTVQLSSAERTAAMSQNQFSTGSSSGMMGGGMSNPMMMGGMMSGSSSVPSIGGLNAQLSGYNPMMSTYHFVNYSGSLSGLLDVVASRYAVYWEWDKTTNGIRFYKTKPKTFRIIALPGDTSLSASIGSSTNGSQSSGGGSSGSSSSGSSGGSSGGGTSTPTSANNASVQFSGLSVWNGIQDAIKTMLSDLGKVTATPATGTITVEDTPLVLERVERYIDSQNESLSKQVVINVKVLEVTLNDTNQYGINWDAVYKNMSGAAGWSLANSFNTTSGSPTLTYQVFKNSQWTGTTAMISALATQGRVSQVTSGTLVTINNQNAPLQVATQTSYLASSAITVGAVGQGNTVSLTPGVVTVGFNMNVLPHILDAGKIMIQYSGDISSLISLNTVSAGGSSIQTPTIDTRNFLQRVIMGSGETLVVAGFEQLNLNGTTQGPVSADAVALGGGLNASKSKSHLVVIMQPVIPGIN